MASIRLCVCLIKQRVQLHSRDVRCRPCACLAVATSGASPSPLDVVKVVQQRLSRLCRRDLHWCSRLSPWRHHRVHLRLWLPTTNRGVWFLARAHLPRPRRSRRHPRCRGSCSSASAGWAFRRRHTTAATVATTAIALSVGCPTCGGPLRLHRRRPEATGRGAAHPGTTPSCSDMPT